MARTITPAQRRIIEYLGRYGAGRWVSLIEIDTSRHLEEDDLAVVPSLVEDAILEHNYGFASVCLSPKGERVLDRMGSRWAPTRDA